jgi:hypothetical protein
MSIHKFLEFQTKFNKIDEEKKKLIDEEVQVDSSYFSWAETHFTREKRETIIQLCIEKQLPDWRVRELMISHGKWEEARENITKTDIALFANIEINVTEYTEDKKSLSRKFFNFINWGGIDV